MGEIEPYGQGTVPLVDEERALVAVHVQLHPGHQEVPAEGPRFDTARSEREASEIEKNSHLPRSFVLFRIIRGYLYRLRKDIFLYF